MNQNEPMSVQFHTYPELPLIDINQMASLAAQTKTLFGHGAKAWIQTFQAITIIRSINKQVPQHVNHLFEMFGPDIMNSFDDVKPIIQRNVIALLSEVFQTGMTIQILPQIFQIFLPKLIIKSQTSEQKMIKDECMVCISHFVINCSFHESGLLAITQLSADNKKHISVQKFSLQVMAKIIQTIGIGIQQYSTQTLSIIMQALCYLLESGKQEVQTFVFQISTFLHQLVGEVNFNNWMQVSLNPIQNQNMIKLVQDYIKKKSKQKHVSISNMKQRISYGVFETQEQMNNGLHFKEFVKDKQQMNFLDLNSVQEQNENCNYQQQFYY